MWSLLLAREVCGSVFVTRGVLNLLSMSDDWHPELNGVYIIREVYRSLLLVMIPNPSVLLYIFEMCCYYVSASE